jgi:hypothetical protein
VLDVEAESRIPGKKVAGGASNRAKENGTKVKKKDNARRVAS